MSFIQREADKLQALLAEDPDGPQSAELGAALQALSWASEPTGFAAPYELITGQRVPAPVCPPQ